MGVSRQLDRSNYLIPVDVTNMQDTNVWWNAVPLDDILKELEKGAPKAANIVVFDACRNELLVPEKNGVKGFEPIAEKKGLLIAFATSPKYFCLGSRCGRWLLRPSAFDGAR
jgi:Caspase domain